METVKKPLNDRETALALMTQALALLDWLNQNTAAVHLQHAIDVLERVSEPVD